MSSVDLSQPLIGRMPLGLVQDALVWTPDVLTLLILTSLIEQGVDIVDVQDLGVLGLLLLVVPTLPIRVDVDVGGAHGLALVALVLPLPFQPRSLQTPVNLLVLFILRGVLTLLGVLGHLNY